METDQIEGASKRIHEGLIRSFIQKNRHRLALTGLEGLRYEEHALPYYLTAGVMFAKDGQDRALKVFFTLFEGFLERHNINTRGCLFIALPPTYNLARKPSRVINSYLHTSSFALGDLVFNLATHGFPTLTVGETSIVFSHELLVEKLVETEARQKVEAWARG